MWIIPQAVLAGLSVSAQESAAWTLDSESFTQLASRSLTWRGKDQPQPCWRRLLKRERWTRLLSGLTFEPSAADLIVELWTASSAATPARERVSPGSCVELTTRGGCGRRSPELCERLGQLGACLRTSPTTSIRDSASSDHNWKRWATKLRQVYSRRRKWAQHIAESDCSSSPWMTPNVPNGGRVMSAENVAAKGATSRGKRQVDLGSQVRQWTTPQAHDSQGAADAARHGRYGTKHGGRNLPDHAAAAMEQWPTPTQPYGTNQSLSKGAAVRPSLQTMAGQWPTPRASPNENRNTKAAPSHGVTHGRTLVGEAQNWSSPRATDGEKGGPNMSFGAGGTPLPAQAVGWATPTTRDGKDGGTPSPNAPTNSLLGHQAPRMLTGGPQLSLPEGWAGSRLYLNPRFVEWLMGWPDQYTSGGWTDCAPAEMESYLSRQRTQLACLLTSWASTGDAAS